MAECVSPFLGWLQRHYRTVGLINDQPFRVGTALHRIPKVAFEVRPRS